MAINTHYVTTKALEEYLVNRTTGEPLAGGTVEFYKDDDRLVAKNVYQLTGAPPNYDFIALPNPLTLSAVGTIQNGDGDNVALYYLPYTSAEAGSDVELYYVVVRDSEGNVQFTREGWPNFNESSQFDAIQGTIVNEISNSQFVTVLFDADLGLTVPYTGASTTNVNIAPDWRLEITHSNSGSLTIARNNIAGTSNTVTNPPYTLTITPGANITDLKLIQRLSNNPDIWTPSETGVRGFVAGGALLGANTSITMAYVSSGGSSQVIFTANNSTGALAYFGETTQLIPGDNPDTGATGYVDIELVLSSSNASTISSVQIVGLDSEQSNVTYRQDTANRQKDYLSHYYEPLLAYKPIPSWLIGWDFPKNPAQFGSSVAAQAVGANKSYYAWDQTIVFQTTNSGVTVSRDSGSQALKTLSANASGTRLALVQYLEQEEVRSMLTSRKCVHIAAKASVDTVATVSLWYTKDVSLPDLSAGTNNSIVLTLDASGYPATRNGTWVQVPRSGLSNASVTTSATNAAQFTIETNATAEFNNYSFSGWDMDGDTDIQNATYFAIVIGTASLAQNAFILWKSIACQDGDIATIPAPKSLEETLLDCRWYYEHSYQNGATPGTLTAEGASYTRFATAVSGGDTNGYLQSFILEYDDKRTVPNIQFYSPFTGTADRISAEIDKDGTAIGVAADVDSTTNWSVAASSGARTFYLCENTSVNAVSAVGDASAGNECFGRFQYVVDARLGIV